MQSRCSERTMTYQVAFRGKDGMVIASDTCEWQEGGSKRKIRKISVDPTGKFAWAYAGRQFSSLVASHLSERFATGAVTSAMDVENEIKESSTALLPEILYDEKPRSTITWIDGKALKAYRTELLSKNLSISHEGSIWTAGFTSQFASLIPERFFDASMTVDQLAGLAAYTIWMANKIEPTLIDGLDIAIYRNSTERFEFLDSAEYWQKAEVMDTKIRDCLSQV
jgi:hypothetical protein